MKSNRIITFILSALLAVTAFAGEEDSVRTALQDTAVAKPAVESIDQTITDNAIVYPKSFQTDTLAMLTNWYIRHYIEMDRQVESKNPVEVSDAEYASRLQSIQKDVPLTFNPVVKSYITHYVKDSRTLLTEIMAMGHYYFPIFENALRKQGLPLELKYLPVVESALNPNALSSTGATGLWQFILKMGKQVGLEVNSLVDERRDPYRSSEAAALYLKQLYDIYHDWLLAIAAYNCEPASVNKAIRRASGKHNFWAIYKYLPKESRGYVPAFIAATYAMNFYQEHNINPSLATSPLIVNTVEVNQRINFEQIASVLKIPAEEIKILNPQYRGDVIPGNNHSYNLALPSQQGYGFLMVEDSIQQYKSLAYAQRGYVEPGSATSSVSHAINDAIAASSGWVDKPSKSRSRTNEKDDFISDDVEYHRVKSGETLASIAQDYQLSVDELKEINGITRNYVSRGQTLKVIKKETIGDVTPTQEDAATTTPPATATETPADND